MIVFQMKNGGIVWVDPMMVAAVANYQDTTAEILTCNGHRFIVDDENGQVAKAIKEWKENR